MLTWNYISQEAYDNLSDHDKSPNILFFIYDKKRILKGTEDFTGKIAIYKDYIDEKVQGVLYLNFNSLEGKIWDGNEYQTVLNPLGYSSIRTTPTSLMNTSIAAIETEDDTNLDDVSSDIIDDLWNKMDKVAPEHTGEVIVADSYGNAKLSGVFIGGEIFKNPPDDTTLATESGVTHKVKEYAVPKSSIVKSLSTMADNVPDASEEKVISENAAVESLTVVVL